MNKPLYIAGLCLCGGGGAIMTQNIALSALFFIVGLVACWQSVY